MTPILSIKRYSGAISQTDKTFLTDNPLHDELPAFIFFLNLHVFIFAETRQTSTTKALWRWNPPQRDLDLIPSKSNCSGRDYISPFCFFLLSGAMGARRQGGGREIKEEELERMRAGEENKTGGDVERQTRRRGGRSQTERWWRRKGACCVI